MKEKKAKKATPIEKALEAENTAGDLDIKDLEKDNESKKEKESEENTNTDSVLKTLAADLNDKYMRTLAEFDNFRKRTDKEKASMYSEGAKDIVAKLLPVIDNFERALKAVDNTEDSFYKGVEMIYKQFKTTLETLGVTEIEAEGKQFDTNSHDAVMHIDDDNYGENEIVEVLQKGYRYKDKVIRYSMVKVAN